MMFKVFKTFSSQKKYNCISAVLSNCYHANKQKASANSLNKWYKFNSMELPQQDSKEILLNNHLSWKTIILALRQQAKNSVLLQVETPEGSCEELIELKLKKFLKKFGSFNYFGKCNQHLYKGSRMYMVEFSLEESAKNIAAQDAGSQNRILTLKLNKVGRNNRVKKQDLNTTEHIKEQLKKCRNMSEQVNLLYDKNSSNSNNIREKFFVASSVEDFFKHHFSSYDFTALPFGTVISGYGRNNSDIDISITSLSTDDNTLHINRNLGGSNILSLREVNWDKAEEFIEVVRDGAVQLFKESSSLLPGFLPNISNLKVIEAKYPLLSFDFDMLDIFTEASFNNRSGVQMGICINIYCRMDKRVSPLIWLVREWMKQARLTPDLNTNKMTYQGITPFMATTLVLFYLMQLEIPVIPPMRRLINRKNKPDDWIMGSFRTRLMGYYHIPGNKRNQMSIQELFIGFLNYYKNMDFKSRLFCLSTGRQEGNKIRQFLNIKSPLHSFESQIGKKCINENLEPLKRQFELLTRRLEDRQEKYSGYEDWGVLSFLDLNKIK